MEIRKFFDRFNFGIRRRKPPEQTEIPEPGAQEICAAVIGAAFKDVNPVQNRTVYMNGLRAGARLDTGLFFIDEALDPKEEPFVFGKRTGIKSNGAHVERYEILEGEVPSDLFDEEIKQVPFEEVEHFKKVAAWLKSPTFDIRQHPFKQRSNP